LDFHRFIAEAGMISPKPLSKLPPLPNPRIYRPRRKPVTVAIGFECADGLLLCADTKVSGPVKANESKIEQFVSDDRHCSLIFGITSDDIHFPRSAIVRCWEYVKQLDFLKSSMEQVHQAAEFSLAEFYQHPDHSPETVYFELLVGIWLRGETRLYQSHETVLNPVDGGFSCLGAGGYLARYLIRQYLKANPAAKTIDEMAVIGSYAVQSAIDFDDRCGGEVEIALIRKTGKMDSSSPAAIYPGDRLIERVQNEAWKMFHDLAEMKDGLEPRTAHRIEEFCAEIKKENLSYQWYFDRHPSIFDR
jgi:20S proteasome alpha/beta subunit